MTDKLATAGLNRRQALSAAATTLVAARAAFPAGAFAAGTGPEVAKARLGFIALTDSAPVIIAKERGLFAKHGMPDVEVVKQASWAATRDNLVLGSGGGGIDGAHILSPMPYFMTLGTITKNKLPVRMECYDWPRQGGPPEGEMLECFSYIDQGFCKPLDEFLEKDPDSKSRVLPEIEKVLRSYDGKIYAMPFFQVSS